MSALTRRRGALVAVWTLGATLLAPDARACEYFSSTLRVLHPWTRATAEGATSVVINMKFDDVAQDDRLLRVETPVADGVEMVGDGATSALALDIAIPAGQTVEIGEAGTPLRLVGLKHPLEVARSYPLRLVFEKGGLVNATLNVDYPSFRFK